jgi:hypothetical protein
MTELFYDVYTGEISTVDIPETRLMTNNWTPYYTLEGKYLGAKEGHWGYRVAHCRLTYVDSYWDL